jgi:hypothetical protein
MTFRSAHILSAAVATAAVLTVSAAVPAQAAASAPPLSVRVATANGSGCPSTTATTHVRPDGVSFTIEFSGYSARTGAGAPTTGFRRNCLFSIQIDRPDGLTYAVEQADYQGSARLQTGVRGVQAAHYYFQGDSTTTTESHNFVGPFADDWATTDTFDEASLRFASCDSDRNLNLNTELRVGRLPGSTATNLMELDSTITLRLTWRECA